MYCTDRVPRTTSSHGVQLDRNGGVDGCCTWSSPWEWSWHTGSHGVLILIPCTYSCCCPGWLIEGKPFHVCKMRHEGGWRWEQVWDSLGWDLKDNANLRNLVTWIPISTWLDLSSRIEFENSPLFLCTAVLWLSWTNTVSKCEGTVCPWVSRCSGRTTTLLLTLEWSALLAKNLILWKTGTDWNSSSVSAERARSTAAKVLWSQLRLPWPAYSPVMTTVLQRCHYILVMDSRLSQHSSITCTIVTHF